MRNKKNDITAGSTSIKMTIREYYKQFLCQKNQQLGEVHKFLGKYQLPHSLKKKKYIT